MDDRHFFSHLSMDDIHTATKPKFRKKKTLEPVIMCQDIHTVHLSVKIQTNSSINHLLYCLLSRARL
jgi:hypothetical protein